MVKGAITKGVSMMPRLDWQAELVESDDHIVGEPEALHQRHRQQQQPRVRVAPQGAGAEDNQHPDRRWEEGRRPVSVRQPLPRASPASRAR
jgi:hypothetical protein